MLLDDPQNKQAAGATCLAACTDGETEVPVDSSQVAIYLTQYLEAKLEQTDKLVIENRLQLMQNNNDIITKVTEVEELMKNQIDHYFRIK